MSYRGQTLARTGLYKAYAIFFLFPAVGETFLYKAVLKFISHVAVRGMMYYKQALDLQYFLEFSSDPGLYPYLSLWKMVDPKFASSFIGCMYCSYLFLIPSFLSFSLFLFMQWYLLVTGHGSQQRRTIELIVIVPKLWLIWSSLMLFHVRFMVLRKNPLIHVTEAATPIY